MTTKPAAPKKPAVKAAAPAVKKVIEVAKKAKIAAPAAPLCPPVVKVKETRDLYTIRLETHLIAKLNALGVKQGISHAAVARHALTVYLAKVA